MRPKNDYFAASASYEHAMTTKISGILVNLTIYLDFKGFCATLKNGFFPAILVIFSCLVFERLSHLLGTCFEAVLGVKVESTYF